MKDDLLDFMAEVAAVLGSDDDPAALPSLADVLDEVAAFIERFMSVTAAQLDALTLWLAHSHCVDVFDVCAYVFVTSADKRCGKSLLLDLLELLALQGRSTSNISVAAMFRMLDEVHPTLCFDEVDNLFAKGKNVDSSRADLVALINTGFRRGKPAWRMGGANMRTLEQFDPFGPKALAGVGACLPDTTADRCVPIRLRRKPRTVTKERFRIRLHEREGLVLRARLNASVRTVADSVGQAWPKLPEQLNDRQQDIWEPLLAIADAAGEEWPTRARAAAVLLKDDSGDESLSVALLADIRRVFTSERMLTKELVAALNALDESPWRDWNRGEGLTSAQLAARLRPYELKSKPVRTADARGRGFELDQFADAFDAYLPDPDDEDDK